MIRRATLFFEPLDVLQFRDHRPFEAGYQVNAESTFPMPSVFLGCLRTALLREQGARFGSRDFGLAERWANELLGTPAKPGTLTLRGPLFARLVDGQVEPLFPAPLDLAWLKEGTRILRPFKPAARRFHGPGGIPSEGDVPWTEANPEKGDARWLFTVAGAKRYLAGPPLELGHEHVVHITNVYAKETRVGITRDNTTLTADDRMFYVTRPFRLAPGAGFAVDVELPGDEADKAIRRLHRAVVPLGGKAHRARIRYVEAPLIPDDLAAGGAAVAGARKLWLVTPLVLGDAGWPKGLTCAASERTMPIGGFDLALRAPKPLRRALPAGTVLTLDGLAPSAALAALGGTGWNDDRRAGYGAALAGQGTETP